MFNWTDLQPVLAPIPDYEDLASRWKTSFSYDFVQRCYNLTIPQLTVFATRELGGDTRHRYDSWLASLTRTIGQLQQVGVSDILTLVQSIPDREAFEGFIARTRLDPAEVINVLKYLVYWYLPAKKTLRQLYREDPRLSAILDPLRQAGIRCSLDLLDRGQTPEDRRALAAEAGVPLEALSELVHRADFARMPWTSIATISNVVGAGYPTMNRLTRADPQLLAEHFQRWGESIGKNLKYGNEILSFHRIAQLMPLILVD